MGMRTGMGEANYIRGDGDGDRDLRLASPPGKTVGNPMGISRGTPLGAGNVGKKKFIQ